jgi:predicted nucleic acid-binding protein
MPVLVDTSVWIDYFRSGGKTGKLDLFIDENLIVINDIIMAELVPFLKVRNQRKIINTLNTVKKLPLRIDWIEIIDFQFKCLKKGINGIGIPDLIIVQNAKQNDSEIYTLDSHYDGIKDTLEFQIIL